MVPNYACLPVATHFIIGIVFTKRMLSDMMPEEL